MEVGAVEIIIIDIKNTKITSIHTGLAGELEFTDELGDWYGAKDDDDLGEQEELVNTEERVQEALQGLHAVAGEILRPILRRLDVGVPRQTANHAANCSLWSTSSQCEHRVPSLLVVSLIW